MHLVSDIASPFDGTPDLLPFLSVNETIYKERLTNAERLYKWCAGRILSKYLFLEYLDNGEEYVPGSLIGFTENNINRFSALQYRAVEILPESRTIGRPVMYMCGSKQSANISLSYSGLHIATAISKNRSIGIDIEQVTERRSEFYTHSFTPYEQIFVNKLGEGHKQKVWLYTLLWTIKEAGLKASTDTGWNLWNLPMMETDLHGAEEELISLYHGTSKGISINAQIKGREGYAGAKLTIQQFNDRILTTLYYE